MKRDAGIRATEYIAANIPSDKCLQKVMNNFMVSYYTNHYFLLSRNTELDKNADYRKKLKKNILKSLSLANLKLRTAIVIIYPSKIMEFISSSYHFVKVKLNKR
jgi:hypothetical protein